MTRQQHIKKLLKEYDIKLIHHKGIRAKKLYRLQMGMALSGPYDGVAWKKAREIAIYGAAHPRAQYYYFIVLHEMGHIICDHPSDSIIEDETEAWLWAFENAIEPMNEVTRKRFESDWYGNYIRGYGLDNPTPKTLMFLKDLGWIDLFVKPLPELVTVKTSSGERQI